MTKQDLILHLRELTQALEQTEGDFVCTATVGIHTPSGDDHAQARHRLAVWARVLGTAEKRYYDDTFWLSRSTDDAEWSVSVFADRGAVCERRVTGTREVPASEEFIVPAKPARTEEIVEWVCDEPILAVQS